MTLLKNLFAIGILIPIILISCSNNDCIENGTEAYWSSNKSIEIFTDLDSIIVGDSIVSLIEYIRVDGQDMLFVFDQFTNVCDDDIADGFGSKEFSMIIPSDSTNSFTYTDEEILETFAFLDVFAAPQSFPHQFVEEGKISGSKIDDSNWSVSIEVVTKPQEFGEVQGDQPEVLSIDTVFSFK